MTIAKAVTAITPGGRVADNTPFGNGNNWVTQAGGLPSYIREVAHALARKGKTESRAIAMAVGIVRNWAEGKGKGVSPAVHAAAAAAIAEWEAKRAKAHVSKNGISKVWSDRSFINALPVDYIFSEIHKDCGCEHDKMKENKRRKKKIIKSENCDESGDCGECVVKRDFSSKKRAELKAKGKTDAHGGFPLEKPVDVKNAVQAIGRAKNPELEKKRIIAAAKKLSCTQMIPDTWNVSKAMFKCPIDGKTYAADSVKEIADHMKTHKKKMKAKKSALTITNKEFQELSKSLDFSDPDTDPDTIEFMVTGDIEKSDNEKQLVFGWCSVARRADGTVVVDKQGDVLEDIDQMEKVAYDFVLHSRDGGEMHVRKGVSTLVESFVSTPEKCAAMGIPDGTLPVGWWVGFKVNDANVWKAVKEGKYRMFSVHGSGTRKALED